MSIIHFLKRLLFLIVTLTALSTFTYAQSTSAPSRNYIPNHMFWLNVVLMGKIHGKFTYQFDLELRRQADPARPANPNTTIGSNHLNAFVHPYQEAIRPWIHYTLNKKIRLSWSPVTWFGTWSNPVNGVVTYYPEFRTSPQIGLYENYGRVIIYHRFRYEFRFYGLKDTVQNSTSPIGNPDSYDFLQKNSHQRFRYMLRATIPLNNKELVKGTWYIMTSAELMLKMGKYISNANIFDQTRTYLGIGYKFQDDFRLEAGYMNQTAFRLDNAAKNNVNFNNIFFVNVLFDDFNRFFRKKSDL